MHEKTNLELRGCDADARVAASIEVVCSMDMQAAAGLEEDTTHEAGFTYSQDLRMSD